MGKSLKVLVGCVTHDKDSCYLEGFLESLRNQSVWPLDLLFVDTSVAEGYDQKLKETGATVLHACSDLDHSIKKITGGRAKVREFFLSHDYDCLIFVDTDVRLPHDAISKLIEDDKEVVGGIYLTQQRFEGKLSLLPVVADFTDEEDKCRPMTFPEALGKGVKEIAWIGFGCLMISRRVLEKVSLRFYEKSMSGEDVAFCVDARAAGFHVCADFDVKCDHLIYQPGDPKNRHFSFDTYKDMKIPHL